VTGVPEPLPPGASPYERQVFVCIFGKTCPGENAVALHRALKVASFERLGTTTTRVAKSGCLAQCGHGPMVVVYPDNVWYAGVTLDDVDEIVEEHFVHGRPVERLFFRGHGPGKNIAPEPTGTTPP